MCINHELYVPIVVVKISLVAKLNSLPLFFLKDLKSFSPVLKIKFNNYLT